MTLIMINKQGASQETDHNNQSAIRRQIRTWQARGMTARVFDDNGECIYDGPALSYPSVKS